MRSHRLSPHWLGLLGMAMLLLKPLSAAAQEAPDGTTGVDSGNYNIQNSIELGWRYSNFTGNAANYDTFVNLHSGVRLLNFSLGLRSLNHNGSLFDNFSLTGFGLGGDPSDVARLSMSKNKWYNFDATFRRDKYFWGYNLLANPLNPANSNPAVPIRSAPHGLDLSRAMSDFDLTLLPEARWHLRLGYSHQRLQGPGASTIHVGTEAPLLQSWHTSTDQYHAGVDFNFLPRTTLSYDQFIQHFKQDTSWVDNDLTFQLSNGVPVDLGIVWDTRGGTPCATPIPNPSTTPPTATPTCNAFTSYARNARPRLTMPTERFTFQTTYFRKLSMVGELNYSSTEQTSRDLQEPMTGFTARTLGRGSSAGGPTRAKQVIVGANWGAVYQATSKFRIVDTFYYNSFRLPGQWNFLTFAQFSQAPSNMLSPLGSFSPSTCPAPYTASTCPQHNSSSAADSATGVHQRFLGQDIRTNTLTLEYRFTPRWGARLGYRYLNRKVHDFDAVFYDQEIFFPGGNAGAAAAARGDCALPPGGVFPNDLPPGCVLQTSGSLAGAVIFSGFTEESDTEHGLMADINGHSALVGFWGRPTDKLRTSFDLELFSADSVFTRITPRQFQRIRIRGTYTPAQWLQLDGSVNILETRNNVVEVRDTEHNRSYSFTAAFSPNDRFAFDLSYAFTDIRTQALDCYSLGFGPLPPGNTPCPIPGSPVPVGALSVYQDKSHFATADMMLRPVKRLTLWLGYAGNFVRGTPLFVNLNGVPVGNFLNPNTPWGPLRFGYQRPYVNMAFSITNHITYKAGWTYYGYNERSPADPATLAPLGTQNFNGNLATFSLRYTM